MFFATLTCVAHSKIIVIIVNFALAMAAYGGRHKGASTGNAARSKSSVILLALTRRPVEGKATEMEPEFTSANSTGIQTHPNGTKLLEPEEIWRYKRCFLSILVVVLLRSLSPLPCPFIRGRGHKLNTSPTSVSPSESSLLSILIMAEPPPDPE
jgi:hypothetical protein